MNDDAKMDLLARFNEDRVLMFERVQCFLSEFGKAIVDSIAKGIQPPPPTMMRKKMRRYQRIVCKE